MNRKWKNQKLGDLFSFKNGRAFKKEEWNSTGLPIIRIQNLNGNNSFNFYSGEYNRDILVQNGDLLFSWAGTVGSSFGPHIWQNGKGLLNQHIFAVSLKTDMCKRYAYYALEKITEDIEDQVNGSVGLVHITKGKLNNFKIPTPPIIEQKRIVEILDKAFENIAVMKSYTQKNLQNAQDLFKGYLNRIFSEKKQLTFRPLSCLCKLISGQHIDAKDYNIESKGIGYLTGPSDFGIFNPSISKWTEYPKRLAQAGDILITVKGSVGKINFLNIEKVAISRQLMAIRPFGINADYLYAFLSTHFEYFQSLSNGTAIPGISRKNVLTLMCPLPSEKEQQDTVNFIHKIKSEIHQLEAIYIHKLEVLNELKKALLDKAFTGKL